MERYRLILFTAISIVFLYFISFSSASELEFHFPGLVEVNKPFNVAILSNFDGEYDVKIYVHNSSDSKVERAEIISQINSEQEWKSSWNYIIGAYPKSKSYSLKITSFSNSSWICVKLRKLNSSSSIESCKTIEIIEPVQVIKLENHNKEHITNYQITMNYFSYFYFFILLIIIIYLITDTNL